MEAMLEILEQPLPHSVEVEQKILAYLLAEEDGITHVIDTVKTEHFYSLAHQRIYRACCEVFQSETIVHLISVSERLSDTGILSEIGGRSYLNDLFLSFLTDGDIPFCVERLLELATRRALIEAGYRILAAAFQETGKDVILLAQKEITSIASTGDRGHEKPLAEVVDISVSKIKEQSLNGGMIGISVGFSSIDKITHGIRDGNLVILAARPAMGKTGLALNIAANLVLRQKLPVLIFSLEMSEEELLQRMIISEAESSTAFDKVEAVGEFIKRAPLKIIDKGPIGVPQVRAAARREMVKHGKLGLIIVDYLQLMDGTGENRTQQISEISRGLKLIAKDFAPVLCLSQLSRNVEQRQDKHPMLSDLRESGSIEQDADIVMFIYRDEYYNKDSHKVGIAEVYTGKNRHWSGGSVDMVFRKGIVKFSERSRV